MDTPTLIIIIAIAIAAPAYYFSQQAKNKEGERQKRLDEIQQRLKEKEAKATEDKKEE